MPSRRERYGTASIHLQSLHIHTHTHTHTHTDTHTHTERERERESAMRRPHTDGSRNCGFNRYKMMSMVWKELTRVNKKRTYLSMCAICSRVRSCYVSTAGHNSRFRRELSSSGALPANGTTTHSQTESLRYDGTSLLLSFPSFFFPGHVHDLRATTYRCLHLPATHSMVVSPSGQDETGGERG